ncbi:MAG: stage III sporulation protein AD [Clostridia bacterium]|nr:stage III sporulation protein AD [Oscillospiraceae bacterium]MBQ2829021.1 stage III sporulation protein AD [Clostridia bacterium]
MMKVFILAIVIAFICMVLKHVKPEYALLCQLCGVVVLVFYLLSSIENVVSSLRDLISQSGIDSSFLEILLKALCFSVLTDIASSLCRDSGNNTLANTVDLAGKTVIVILALPILRKLAEAAIGFIK